jgi:hypothetical protein
LPTGADVPSGADSMSGEDQRDAGHHHRHLTKPTDAGEGDFDPLEPLDISVVKDEVQEQHQQERSPNAAICGWAAMISFS